MTPPIQEPTTQRSVSGLQWGENQLARRPKSASCPCPFETGIAYDSVTGDGTGTVSDNTLTTIFFDQVSISSGATAIVPGSASPGTSPLKLDADGFYLFYLDFEWSGGAFTDTRYYDLHFSFNADNDGNQDISANEQAPFEGSFHRTWGPLYFRGSSLHPNCSVKVWQNAGGGPQTITGVLYTILYLGPDLDPARFPPF